MLNLGNGRIVHALVSIIKYCLMIALSPVLLLLAFFYAILHSNRGDGDRKEVAPYFGYGTESRAKQAR